MNAPLTLGDVVRRHVARPMVYPAYIGFRLKQALKGQDVKLADNEQIIESVGDLETIGDCKYALAVTDHNGTTYRVTVQIEDDAAKAVV